MKISVIIPTFNRVKLLRRTLQSLLNIDSCGTKYEILIIDNGSTDETKEFTRSFIENNQHTNLNYIKELTPGLLSCRHRGYKMASGNILAYLDDDVIVSKNWIQGIREAFSEPNVQLAGGPSLPYYEEPPPEWLEYFWARKPSLHSCPWLSLIWQGEKIKKCEPDLIWGLNFCVRKETISKCLGFNPDCIPGHLQHFQGDGESGLARKLKKHGYISIYHPSIMVHHIIPRERMTHEYFKKRFYYEGVVCSYADIRENNGILTDNKEVDNKREKKGIIQKYFKKIIHPRSSIRWFLQEKGYINNNDLNLKLSEEEKLRTQFYQAYLYGYNYHQEMVKSYPNLLKWVLKEDYFDYQLPDLKEVAN